MHCCAGPSCGHEQTWMDIDGHDARKATHKKETTTSASRSRQIASISLTIDNNPHKCVETMISLCASCEKPMHGTGLCSRRLLPDTYVCHPCYAKHKQQQSPMSAGDKDVNKDKISITHSILSQRVTTAKAITSTPPKNNSPSQMVKQKHNHSVLLRKQQSKSLQEKISSPRIPGPRKRLRVSSLFSKQNNSTFSCQPQALQQAQNSIASLGDNLGASDYQYETITSPPRKRMRVSSRGPKDVTQNSWWPSSWFAPSTESSQTTDRTGSFLLSSSSLNQSFQTSKPRASRLSTSTRPCHIVRQSQRKRKRNEDLPADSPSGQAKPNTTPQANATFSLQAVPSASTTQAIVSSVSDWFQLLTQNKIASAKSNKSS